MGYFVNVGHVVPARFIMLNSAVDQKMMKEVLESFCNLSKRIKVQIGRKFIDIPIYTVILNSYSAVMFQFSIH